MGFRSFILLLFLALLVLYAERTQDHTISLGNPRADLGDTFEVVILPHHGITGKKIDEFYGLFKEKYKIFDRIVIISPDHYGLTKQSIESLPLGLGEMCYMTTCVRAQSMPLYATGSESGRIFSNSGVTREHGLGEHIIRIKEYFPEASVSPIVLRRKLSAGPVELAVADTLASIKDSRVLVVASVDFSHHVREEFARLHDIKSIDVLDSGTIEDFENLEVDCRNCLAVAKGVAKKRGKSRFSLYARTSVDSISGTGAELDNTSHIFGAFVPDDTTLSDTSTGVFLFAGDTHWARGFPYYEKRIDAYTGKVTSILYQLYDPTRNPMTNYHRLFLGMDDVIVNFESGLASDVDCPRMEKETQMWTDPYYLPWLHSSGISMVNFANNHSHDCGNKIYNQSIDRFASGGMLAFGYDTIVYRTIRGNNYAFLGIDTTTSRLDIGSLTGKLSSLTASGYIPIVNVHWGIEYSTESDIRQQTLAHNLIDAGARLIIGHHPHVVQNIEIYKGIPIYYSLGNFLFDQPFPETLRGLIVGCEISTTQTRCQDFSIYRDKKDFSLSFSSSSGSLDD